VRLELAADDLRPIVQAVVAEVLQQRAALESSDRLGYTEPEAAAALGVAQHRLRDARLRGEIHAKRLGRGYLYSRESLLSFLAATN
jgi:Helix-turn-helix domain